MMPHGEKVRVEREVNAQISHFFVNFSKISKVRPVSLAKDWET